MIVQAVRPGSVAGGGCYGVMEFGMSRGIKPKKEYVRISNEGNRAQFWTVRQKVKGSYIRELVSSLDYEYIFGEGGGGGRNKHKSSPTKNYIQQQQMY